MPSPGRQTSGMAATNASETGPGVGRMWYPADLPQGYHPATRGQSYSWPGGSSDGFWRGGLPGLVQR
jgi:hypothetical protein